MLSEYEFFLIFAGTYVVLFFLADRLQIYFAKQSYGKARKKFEAECQSRKTPGKAPIYSSPNGRTTVSPNDLIRSGNFKAMIARLK